MSNKHSIEFYYEEIEFPFPEEEKTKLWISHVLTLFNIQSSDLNYIFCSDDYLLKVNQEHLNHDYYTDIITFPLEVTASSIQSDMFISYDRILDNATTHGEEVNTELRRVMIHGVLHMLGFGDKTKEEQERMRAKEDEMLKMI